LADRLTRLPGLRQFLLVSFTGFSGYAALLATAPTWAVHGGADEAGAGLVTFVLRGSTGLTQLGVPRMLARFGHAKVLAFGLLAIGGPAFGYLLSDALLPILAVSAVRGIGFGILTVTMSAMIAELVPPERLGAAVGVYGLSVATPMVVLLPAAVAIQQHASFGWVCLLGTIPVLGVPWALALAGHLNPEPPSVDPADTGPVGAQVWRPTVVLFVITAAGGALTTFLPQLAGGRTAAAALFVLGLLSALTRWRAGHLADRSGPDAMVAPLLVVGAAGLGLVVWGVAGHTRPVALLLGTALVAIAYGALQNLTLLVAFRGLSRAQIPRASSAWNIGYDAGTAVGALAVGAVASAASFELGFGVLALACLLALALLPGMLSDSRAGRRTPPPAP
jgi:predicted MFS family arabinose efflux permease